MVSFKLVTLVYVTRARMAAPLVLIDLWTLFNFIALAFIGGFFGGYFFMRKRAGSLIRLGFLRQGHATVINIDVARKRVTLEPVVFISDTIARSTIANRTFIAPKNVSTCLLENAGNVPTYFAISFIDTGVIVSPELFASVGIVGLALGDHQVDLSKPESLESIVRTIRVLAEQKGLSVLVSPEIGLSIVINPVTVLETAVNVNTMLARTVVNAVVGSSERVESLERVGGRFAGALGWVNTVTRLFLRFLPVIIGLYLLMMLFQMLGQIKLPIGGVGAPAHAPPATHAPSPPKPAKPPQQPVKPVPTQPTQQVEQVQKTQPQQKPVNVTKVGTVKAKGGGK